MTRRLSTSIGPSAHVDIDVETFDVVSKIELSQHTDLRLPLRWVGLLRPMFPEPSIAVSPGAQSGADVVKAILAGAGGS
jgi:hypothetical protein